MSQSQTQTSEGDGILNVPAPRAEFSRLEPLGLGKTDPDSPVEGGIEESL